MRLKIAHVGESVLRTVARELSPEEIQGASTRQLIEYMRETLSDAPGVGLAAPQVGESVQLAVIEDKHEYHSDLTPEQLAERERSPVDFTVIINPQIELLSTPDAVFFEGCLSLPGFVAMVPRAHRVRVRALDQFGSPIQIDASGWYARILQHEICHLQGQLYLDAMWSRSFSTFENYNRTLKLKSTSSLIEEFGPSQAMDSR